ncbi:MAG: two-component regulator propeller domain-containing protein [Vicingaceae bacterium]|nr:two-component regulator propeller domain-containing protein [Vicingaceae bacterium]
MINRLFIIIILVLLARSSTCQEISVGSWRDHLPYVDAVSVTETNNLIYCATNSALFSYDKSDFSIDRLNVVNSLSDIGISAIKFDDFNKKTVIAYVNGNIDVIDENKNITNLSAIKNSNILGSKNINHIYFQGKLAYLSTGFGIVVLNTEKEEVVETYFFGPLGNPIFTNAVTIDAVNIYAATNQGVFVANKNSANLIDFNEWSLLPELGISDYSYIVSFANTIFVSLDLPTIDSDTVYYNNGGSWEKFIPNGVTVNSLNVSQNNLLVSFGQSIDIYAESLLKVKTITHFNTNGNVSPADAIIDTEGFVLIADIRQGLIKIKNNFDGQIIHPNGPSTANVFKMDFLEDNLWVVSGGYSTGTFEPSNVKNHIYSHNENNYWKASRDFVAGLNGERTRDAVAVAINPSNSSEVFIGTWDQGLFQLNNGVVSNIFTAENSVLDSTSFGTTKVGALAFDKDNNLWVSSSFTDNQLAVKTPENEWYKFSLVGLGIAENNVFTSILIDQNNNKWIVEPKTNSLIVINHGTLGDPNTIQSKKLTPSVTELPGTQLYSITEDKDGEIWIGTDEGVAVFYNPSNVFDEDIKAEQIFVEQDGQTQILLESEVVTVITIDGANRKWIGTETSGVFLMSEDGTQEIEHFTTDNSPLFSNNIFDIVIDPETGEVYIGTEKGLISYKGTATEGGENYENVYVYPNPVKPDFTGSIAIRGLLKDTDVRITDISGNIVYQTTSFGGQAIWDGKDFNGNKVQTGVYMIFNGSENGDQKAAAKILIYH